MTKLAIAQVAWNTQTSIYQVQEKTARGATIPHMDFESATWQEWLERMPSFAFQSKDGYRFTARKEIRARGGTYWVAYRKRTGKLTHAYLGRPADITLSRLEEVAAALAEGETARPLTSSAAVQIQDSDQILVQDPFAPQLLTTKFFVPVASHALIARPRLMELRDEIMQRPLTLVSAPAGFGKTSLLSAWVQSLPPGSPFVCWISLDEDDNDPVRFWISVLTALDRVRPGMVTDLLTYVHTRQLPPLQSILSELINRLTEQSAQFLLVLDDYHLLTEQAIHTSFAYLLDHLPPQLCLLLATRMDPALPLSRLRARGQMLEVRAEQLRCTLEEARTFFRDVMDIELEDAAIHQVTRRTEGWWVGLQLMGLSLQGHAPPGASISLLEEASGTQHYILDYLTEEVLQQQPAAIQSFLLRTSILSRLSAPLCDAVLQQQGSQQLLESLHRCNLFVTTLDNQRHWYRYHDLFAEVLRARLEQTPGEEIHVLHLRASQWYAHHGSPNEAISHALLAGAWEFAADLIERTPFTLFCGEREQDHIRLRTYLAQLPDTVVRSRPRLCLATAQILHDTNSPPTMLEPWLKTAEVILATQRSAVIGTLTERSSRAQDEHANLLGEIIAFRAYLCSYQGDVEVTLALCQTAWPLLSAENVRARCDLALAQAVAKGASGETTAGYESAHEAARLAQAGGNISYAIFYLSFAALFLIACGRLHEAWQELQQAVDLGNKPGGIVLPTMCWVETLQAEILREWNRLDEALEAITRAIYLGEQIEDPTVLVMAYAVLVRIALSRGDLSITHQAIQQGKNAGLKIRDVALRDYLRSHFAEIDQVRFLLTQGELDSVRRVVEGHFGRGSKVMLFAHRSEEVALIRLQLAQQQPAEALVQLVPLLEMANKQERWGHVIELLLLQALAYQGMQQEDRALVALEQAVRLAEPEGYIRSFVDEGTSMRTLISDLREQQRKQWPRPYLDTVLTAFSQEYGTNQPALHLPPDLLSPREREVLHLLAQGAHNWEIAQALVVTVDTVKRHVSNILAKLEVSNRTQAVMRARELGLLQEQALSEKP